VIKRYFSLDLTIRQFVKYAIAGGFSFIVENAAFYMLHRILELWYVWSNSVAMTLGFIISFFLNRAWSFKSQGNLYRQFIMYGVLFIINLFISNGLMMLFSGVLKIAPPVAKLVATGIIVCWNFVIYRGFIFK